MIEEALKRLPSPVVETLMGGLQELVRNVLDARDGRTFGMCKACKYYAKSGKGGFCMLLKEELTAEETLQICHEYQEAA
jgi:hypothetical protein